MHRGLVSALASVAGIAAAFGVQALGFDSLLSKAAAFVVGFVLVFGGYTWLRKANAISGRPRKEP